ncbi:MAG: hypothetical protein COA47_12215 [Robiginitomaculum sp.]|nr:MAG: hypothetical protein COA47_12215 [Robiginitomaculum sp.]
MEEELVGTVIEAGVLAAMAPDEIELRADDTKSEFQSSTALDECSNCNTVLEGRYCHVCGQVADTFHRPLWSLFADIFDGLFGLDGRIWRTIPPLMLRPGEITLKYLSGVRKPYLQPFKLFLAASVLFFLVFELAIRDQTDGLQLGPDGSQIVLGTTSKKERREAIAAIKEARNEIKQSVSTSAGSAVDDVGKILEDQITKLDTENTSPSVNAPTKEQIICAMQGVVIPKNLSEECKQLRAEKKAGEAAERAKEELSSEVKPDPGSELRVDIDLDDNSGEITWLDLQSRQFLATNIETAIRDPQLYAATVGRWAPRLAFFLAPFFGFLLALSYFWRRKLYVYDHMIVALHFHSFLFLFLAILIPFGILINPPLAVVVFIGWSNFYLWQLHKKIYGSSWFTAGLRVLALDFVYFNVLVIGLLGLLVLGILLL